MAKTIETDAILYTPRSERVDRNGVALFLDPERGNWIGTDPRGALLLEQADGARTLGQIVSAYATERNVGPAEALLHATTFFGHLERRGFADRKAFNGTPYEGRDRALKADRLREVWIHTNNSCNLKCSHCLVSSGPDGDRGLPTLRIKQIVDEAIEAGTEQLFFTGGEPFVRPDMFELIRHVTQKANLIVLTNGLLFNGRRLEELRSCSRESLGLQISLDGPDSASNDAIRGEGTFEGICEGIRTAVKEGFNVVVLTNQTGELLGSYQAGSVDLRVFPSSGT